MSLITVLKWDLTINDYRVTLCTIRRTNAQTQQQLSDLPTPFERTYILFLSITFKQSGNEDMKKSPHMKVWKCLTCTLEWYHRYLMKTNHHLAAVYGLRMSTKYSKFRFYSKFKIWMYWFVITVVYVQLIKTQIEHEIKPIDWLGDFFISTFRITHFFKLVLPPSSHLLKVTAKVQSHRIKNWLFRYCSWDCCICFITVALFSFVKKYIKTFLSI